MSNVPIATKPLGRPRRIVGLCILAIGVLLVARVLWLGFAYWPSFGSVERLRFYVVLWLGTVLSLFGCWLAFRSRAALWAFFIVLASTLAYGYLNDWIISVGPD